MPEHDFVREIPDLIHPADYATDPEGRLIRLRLQVTNDGLEVIGDSVHSEALERLLTELGAKKIEQMLCG